MGVQYVVCVVRVVLCAWVGRGANGLARGSEGVERPSSSSR